MLFGREFNLLDLLQIWDAIFGVSNDLKFTYFIVVAMLIHIRDQLLSNDYAECLMLLMKYPSNADVNLIIRHALHMFEPNKYKLPSNAFVYTVNSMKQQVSNRTFTPFASVGLSMKTPLASPKKLRNDLYRETARIAKNTKNHDEIIDGYSIDNPVVLKMELQDSYNIMSVSRLKLKQYLTVLRKYVPGNQINELSQTLVGIEELISLLKPKNQYLFDVTISDPPIDPAIEADDSNFLYDEPSITFDHPSIPIRSNETSSNENTYEVPNYRKSKSINQISQQKREVEMDLIRSSIVDCINLNEYPSDDPSGERRNSLNN